MGSQMNAVQRKEHDKDPGECRPVYLYVFVFILGVLYLLFDEDLTLTCSNLDKWCM